MKFVTAKTPLAAAVGLMVATSVWAKVPANEAEQLGKELTCVGAIKAGNKEGTIPEFTGKWVGAPAGVSHVQASGKHPVDIYADEKPIAVITAENVDKYGDKLSDGQKAMFKKYPKTMQIQVYKGHRDFRYTDEVCAIAKKNALESEVNPDGNSIKGSLGAINFPIPKTGLEVVWNNLLPTRAYNENIVRDMANVMSDGSIAWGRQENINLSLDNLPSSLGKPVEGVMAYSRTRVLAPEREKGGVTHTVEPVNFAKDKRLAWSYDPGTRRVRQVPEYGFDQPMPGTGGKLTIDSDRLLDGYRHMFGRRVLFLDEDTGQALMSDYYDARGQLWLQSVVNHYYAFDARIWHAGTSFYHDLNSGGYVAYNLFQERPQGPVLNKGNMTAAMFTPEAARNAGN